MSSSPQFTRVQVPARIADLEFNYLRPADFHVVPLPNETPDFSQPTCFHPLEIAMAGYGAVLFSVSARPAFNDGTVQDWAEFLGNQSGTQIVSMKPATLGVLPALLVEATQPSEAGTMRIRTAMLEDGGRFVNVSVLAPDAIWASVEPTLVGSLMSFQLAEPRGTRTPLTRDAACDAAGKMPAPATRLAAEQTPARPTPSASEPSLPAELALADNAASLDPEHPFNRRLRDNGAGLTPRVHEINAAEKYAVIGAAAIASCIHVPLGWHVIDDGRRTLVFDAKGEIQINLNLRRDDGDSRALLDQIVVQARSEQPQIDPVMVDFAPDMPGVVLRNYRDGDDVLVQAFVVRQLRDDGLAHVARVTASPDHMTRAMNLAEIVLRSLDLHLAAR